MLIAVVIPHLLAKVDPVDTGGNDLRELVRLEKLNANQIARLQSPFIYQHQGQHYVTYGIALPVELEVVRLASPPDGS